MVLNAMSKAKKAPTVTYGVRDDKIRGRNPKEITMAFRAMARPGSLNM
jgi:hypothetical protein